MATNNTVMTSSDQRSELRLKRPRQPAHPWKQAHHVREELPSPNILRTLSLRRRLLQGDPQYGMVLMTKAQAMTDDHADGHFLTDAFLATIGSSEALCAFPNGWHKRRISTSYWKATPSSRMRSLRINPLCCVVWPTNTWSELRFNMR
jgi:hypothetical protein